MKVINYEGLPAEIKKWLELVINNQEGVIIKKKNQKDLLLISAETYNALSETYYLLSGRNREILLNSIDEIKTGESKK